MSTLGQLIAIGDLKQTIREMKAALAQCEDYFDNRADADGGSMGFTPNAEMSLLVEVRQALAAADSALEG